MDRESELALIERLRRGDPAAIAETHRLFHPRLFGFLARMARSRDVAEDLVEETWLRLVRHAAALQPDTRLAPWLFTVARNLYVSYCRNRALDDAVMAEIGLWPAQPAPSPFELSAASELEARIEAALAALPASFREVLLLVGSEGLTPSEAASVCGLTPDAMRQRLSRARAALAAALEPRASRRDVLSGVRRLFSFLG
jgi:RNA polymerase sigma-70 factor (ECF subfamily)